MRTGIARLWRARIRLLVAVLGVLGIVIACSSHFDDNVASSSEAYNTCGADYLDQTVNSSTSRNYTGSVGILIPSVLTVNSGAWTGQAYGQLTFATATDTITCTYNQFDTNTSTQPFQFTSCVTHTGAPAAGARFAAIRHTRDSVHELLVF